MIYDWYEISEHSMLGGKMWKSAGFLKLFYLLINISLSPSLNILKATEKSNEKIVTFYLKMVWLIQNIYHLIKFENRYLWINQWDLYLGKCYNKM